MTVTLSPLAGAGWQFFDNSGQVLTGGKLYTYAAGTTTPLETYTTFNGNVANSNPIVLDAAGRVPYEIWINLGVGYKFVLKDTNDVPISTWDNIPSNAVPPLSNNASAIAYQQGNSVTAGAFIVGITYLITSIGTTNFVAIGAASNTVGIYFTATGVGSGTGTALTSVTVQAKLQQTISVKDFGAKGDGSTNDSVAIQNAVNTAQNVYFPASTGAYIIGSTINVPSNTNIIIDNSVTVKAASGLTGDIFKVTSANNVNFNGGTIDGNSASAGANGINIVTSTNCSVQNCTIKNTQTHCIYVQGTSSTYCQYILIENNNISYSITAPCFTFIYTNYLKLIGNTIHHSSSAGMTSGASNYITASNNQVYSNHDDGLAFGDSCSNLTITGNNSANNGAEGINVDGCNHATITGNTSYNNLLGITVWNRSPGNVNAGYNIVDSNVVESCAQNILIADGQPGIVVTNNISRNSGNFATLPGTNSYGIYVSTGAGTIIANNLIANSLKSGIYAVSTIDVTIKNNLIENNAHYGIELNSGTGFGRNVISNNYLLGNGDGSTYIYGIYDGTSGYRNVFDSNVFVDESSPVKQTTPFYIQESLVWITNNRNLSGTSNLPVINSGSIGNVFQQNNSWQLSTYAPTSGTWNVGDIVLNANPASGGYIGYVCTVAGTPGTWKSYGAIV